MDIGKAMYRAAAELVYSRYPKGWGGAAAMYTSDKRILTSVAPDATLPLNFVWKQALF